MNKITLILSFMFTVSLSSFSYAQYNSKKMAVAGGAYIAAVNIMEKLSQSRCDYLVRRKYKTSTAVKSVKRYLSRRDQISLDNFLTSTKWRKELEENKNIIQGSMSAYINSGLDYKTACGSLMTLMSQKYIDAKNNFYKYARIYGYKR